MNTTLEIACFNVQSALNAANAGAGRIEICDNINDGGTTPSYGTIKYLKENINTPLFVMLRPRGGDFLYTPYEFKVMEKDLQLIKQLGCEGVVLGFLKADGAIDTEKTSWFVEMAYPMEVTFHRAFDRAKDALKALEDIIECGCQRILTSGQKPTVVEALPLIKELIDLADERISIMPGSGVKSDNIRLIHEQTGATELHASTKLFVKSAMDFIRTEMDEDLKDVLVNEEEIRLMKAYLNSL